MSTLPVAPTLVKATLKTLTGKHAKDPALAVQFNPATLEYTISNEFDDRNGDSAARQIVKKSTAKLTMTLVFDTTDTGTEVRLVTGNIAELLPRTKKGEKVDAPKVQFAWGTYVFVGVAEQFKETVDFFSASGVALRSSVVLTLSEQKVVFDSSKNKKAAPDKNPPADPVNAPAGQSAADLSNALGDPRAARAIANANGAASLRFGDAGQGYGVGSGVPLAPAAAFSPGASTAASSTPDGNAATNANLGVGTGSAGDTSFAGLRAAPSAPAISLDDARAALLPSPRLSGATTFGPGGRATVQAGASLATDVGATADLHDRIGFGA